MQASSRPLIASRPMTLRPLLLTTAVALALVGGACSEAPAELTGSPGDPSAIDRVIEIDATNDLEFEPASIEVSAGETVELRVNNVADVDHELVLGPQHEHHEGMDHSNDPSGTGAIKPGASGSVVWEFTEAGEVTFACYIANHNQAGMTGTVAVAE